MASENERVHKRLYEAVWNGRGPRVVDDLVHEKYQIHDRELAEELQGPELYETRASKTRKIFPDATVTIDDIVAADQMVASERPCHVGEPIFCPNGTNPLEPH